MKQIWKQWRKHLPAVRVGLIVVVLVGIVAETIWMNHKMALLSAQLNYLQDTVTIIRTETGNLQTDIEKTLREENSFLESYEIKVIDTDFSAGTYQLLVTVIPKEYTDETKLRIYFGTEVFELYPDGFVYSGIVDLPLNKSYEGNVTVLITNGTKRNTEVLEDYVGFQEQFEGVLQGTMSDSPILSGNTLSIRCDVDFVLQGQDTYGVREFSSLKLIVEADGENICEEELIDDGNREADDQSKTYDQGLTMTEEVGGTEVAETESEEEESGANKLVKKMVDGIYGSQKLRLKQEIEDGASVSVYLKAVSSDGFCFIFRLYDGVADEEEGELMDQTGQEEPQYQVLDRSGSGYIPAARKG